MIRTQAGAFRRFLLSGAFNTAATYAIYLALLLVLPYAISYTIAFCAGIVIAYVLTRSFVFRVNGSVSTVFTFPLIYLVQYLTGIAVVSAWIELFGGAVTIAPIAAAFVTVPLTFILSKWLFMRRYRAC